MDEEFKVSFKLVDNGFESKIDKYDKKLRGMDKPHNVKLSADVRQFDKQTRQAFETFNRNAKKYSKVNLSTEIFGDPRKQFAFARLFNDIRDSAANALDDISKQAEDLSIKIQMDDKSSSELDKQYEEAVQKMKALQAEKEKYEYDNDPANIDFNKIVEETARLNQLRSQAMGEQKSATNKEEWEAATQKIREYNAELDKLSKMTSGEFGPSKEETARYEEVKTQIKELEPILQRLDKQLESTEFVKEEDMAKLEALKTEYQAILNDLNKNPLDVKMDSDTLGKWSKSALQLKQRFGGVNQEMRKFNLLSRIGRSLITRMTFQIVSWLNPFNIIKKVWSEFKEQNEDVANTFEMIGKNLVKVFEPMMRKITEWLLKAAQYLNIFTKSWFNVDLFDKSVLSSDKVKENLKKANEYTTGFDELHLLSEKDEDDDKKKTVMDTTGLPNIDQNWAKKLQETANKTKPIIEGIGKMFSWALEHPILAAAAVIGGKFALGLLGKGVGKLIGAGIKKLFGGTAATEGAKAGGSLLGNLFGKTLYTGMGGKAVTVGKMLGGVALAAGGTALAISQAADAGSNWQDLDTKTKAVKVGMVGLGSAAAGVGAVMLGASGPVGWAVAGVVALTAFTIGMAQTQDGIGSVKEETEKLAEAQANAKTANDNYLTSVNNLAITTSNLEQAERATGLSGKDLAEQVKAGKLEVDNMTSAQLQVYNAYLQNEEMIKQLKEATEQKKEADKQAVLQSLKVDAANAIESKSYDELREKVVKAWKEGSISAEEAGDILSRTMANADDDTQKTFGDSIPKAIKDAYNPDKYESGWRKFGNNFKNMMNDLGKWFSDKWNGIKNWWNGLWGKNKTPEPETPSGPNGEQWNGASYAVGTPYVPNDQLAMVHKGEAIIPAKYNNASTFGGNNSAMASTISAMTNEIAALRSLINAGIPVKGEFKQRGSDLVAVVEKGKNKNGNQPLGNPAYAR